jgi:hypothetical protein
MCIGCHMRLLMVKFQKVYSYCISAIRLRA